jgi:hypothetical protein
MGLFGSRPRRSRGRNAISRDCIPADLAAYIDPFDAAAPGLRYPDEFRGLSGTYTTNLEIDILTAPAAGTFNDANLVSVAPVLGSSLFLLTPDPSNLYVQGLYGNQGAGGGQWSGVPNMFAWPNGVLFSIAQGTLNAFGPGSGTQNIDVVASNITALRSLFRSARLVTGGAKLTGTMNFSSVSGTIHVCPVPVDLSPTTILNATIDPQNPALTEIQNGWQCTLPQNLNDMINMPGYVETPLASLQTDELVAIFGRYGAEAKLFKETTYAWGMANNVSAPTLSTRTGTAGIPDNYGHYAICVLITGVQQSNGTPAAAGTTICELELRNHYECQASPSAFALFTSPSNHVYAGQGLITQAPAHQPVYDAAADNVASRIPVVRVIDDAGVEEASFMTEVGKLWDRGVAVANSLMPAIEVIGPMIASLML